MSTLTQDEMQAEGQDRTHRAPAYQVVDPATGELVESVAHATDAEVEAALEAAARDHLAWRDASVGERAAALHRIADGLRADADTLARSMQREMGKPLAEGVEEVEYSAAIFDYYADRAAELLADEELTTTSAGRAVLQRRSLGPLLGVMPWNYPCYQVARFVAPNLLVGNTVLIKHAESVPHTARLLQERVRSAGVPDGGYTNLYATHDQVATMIADPRVQGVSLTGSERAGAAVAALAGQHLKKCVLELGGSDPFVVLDSDDVTGLAQVAWETRVYNNGQACNSNKRLIVMDDVYDEFVAALVGHASAVDPGAHPPMASRAAAEGLAAQVDAAVAQGARLLAGGVLASGPSAHYSPAVLVDVTPSMRAYAEELFGPVAVVYRVTSDEEAVALANATPYGLGGAVFSADPERARRVADRLEVGMANVNTPAGDGPELPFGGVKRSGFGRELGPGAVDEFANKRLFFVATF